MKVCELAEKLLELPDLQAEIGLFEYNYDPNDQMYWCNLEPLLEVKPFVDRGYALLADGQEQHFEDYVKETLQYREKERQERAAKLADALRRREDLDRQIAYLKSQA